MYETKNREEIFSRLSIVFKESLQFRGYYPSLVILFGDIGWSDIYSFKIVDESHVLIGPNEFNLDKLVVYRPNPYWQYFIYLECAPDSPTGLYKKDKRRTREEYAICKQGLITREEYDDGYIFRSGKSIEVQDAELRVRHLSRYNFIITSRISPINITKFDATRCSILKAILKGDKSLQDFIEAYCYLPRNPNDD